MQPLCFVAKGYYLGTPLNGYGCAEEIQETPEPELPVGQTHPIRAQTPPETLTPIQANLFFTNRQRTPTAEPGALNPKYGK